jgi:hypothetical protein
VLEERKLAFRLIAAHAATLLFLLIYFWVLVITAVDYPLFYAVFPYPVFVSVALGLLLALLPGRMWRLKLGLILILATWFSILPRVSWHWETKFFINAGMLHRGMPMAKARAWMHPFTMKKSANNEEIWFQPWPYGEDACIVKLRGDRIRDVILRHQATAGLQGIEAR